MSSEGLPDKRRPIILPPLKSPSRAHLVDLAVEVWRLEQRVKALTTAGGNPDSSGLQSSVSRFRDLLEHEHVEYHDHTGEPYNEGLGVEVVVFEKGAVPVGSRMITETLRPTIYLSGQVVAHGQVVVTEAA